MEKTTETPAANQPATMTAAVSSAQIYMSEEISEIAGALSEFQGMLTQPKLEKTVSVKTKTGGTYTFRYADLSACIRSAAPALKQTGLAVTQIVAGGKLLTLLIHKSGQWIKSVVLLPQQNADYQGFGSALTYLKRYTYCALLGIVADDDDDANYASGNTATQVDNGKSPKRSSDVSAANLMSQALKDAQGIHNMDNFHEVWNKWNNSHPEITKNGTDFWKAMAQKNAELNQ